MFHIVGPQLHVFADFGVDALGLNFALALYGVLGHFKQRISILLE